MRTTPAFWLKWDSVFMHQTIDFCDYYVSVKNGPRVGYLLGPYGSYAEADAQVSRAKELADRADPYAHFYAYGVCRAPEGTPIRTVFGR